MAEAPATAPGSCLACRHFFITHRLPQAYGCRVLGFKSPALPCLAWRCAVPRGGTAFIFRIRRGAERRKTPVFWAFRHMPDSPGKGPGYPQACPGFLWTILRGAGAPGASNGGDNVDRTSRGRFAGADRGNGALNDRSKGY